MSVTVDHERLEWREIDELERIYAREPGHPPDVSTPPQATLTVTRNSPHDFSDRQIYVWIDDEECGKIRYGHSIVREVEPGPHRVRVFNTLLSRTFSFEARPGESVRLRCGTGMPTVGWLMMFFLHVTYLRVWLEPDA